MNNTLINEAIYLATEAHSGQTRKSTSIPYILHPLETGVIAGSLSTKDGKVDEEIVAASILHDTIEDTNITKEMLENKFPKRVVDLVLIQSEDKSKSWKERKAHTIEMLKFNKSKDVEIVILADKLANLRAIIKDYNTIGDELWSRFNSGKDNQIWYYKAISENINQIRDSREYQEYIKLLEIIN